MTVPRVISASAAMVKDRVSVPVNARVLAVPVPALCVPLVRVTSTFSTPIVSTLTNVQITVSPGARVIVTPLVV